MKKIIRKNFGWYKRKHGILLDPLPRESQKILLENKFLRDIADNDQVMQIIFHIGDMEQQNKKHRKWWYNPYTNEVTSYKELLEDSNYLDWKCAICNIEILSAINKFTPDNFCCDDCREVHCDNPQKIDQRIVDSSLKFTEHSASLLKREQKDFLLYTKRNSKD